MRSLPAAWPAAPHLMAEGQLNEKANDRFDATALAAMSRIFAREAALKVAQDGLRWVVGAGGVSDAEMPAFEATLGLPAIHRAQAGLIADMDYVADVLVRPRAEASSRTAHGSSPSSLEPWSARLPILDSTDARST